MPTTLKAALLGFLALGAGTGATARFARADKPAGAEAPTLVSGGAVQLPAETVTKLGIATAEAKPRAAARARVLQLNGSTALDPAGVIRIRGRFAPFEVLEIGKPGGTEDRTLRPGDIVSKGQVLAAVRSQDVANKKSDLFDAAVQLKLDEAILEQAEKAAGAVPEVFILNARRNVQAGRSAVNRARNALLSWGLSNEDIAAVRKQAEEAAGKPRPDTEEVLNARLKDWARVVLKAPAEGVIVERNVSVGELVKDQTQNLFTIANLDRLLVVATVGEDDLPALHALKGAERRWVVRAGSATVEGPFDEIGYLVDVNEHTTVIKGRIDSKNNQFRAGQFVTASITLPPVSDEVVVPAAALVEEQGQTFVFVQPDPRKPVYEQRRVTVVRRGTDTAHVRTRLSAGELRQGVQTVRAGERVVTTGAIELKALSADLKSN
jgi:cobalt-zinc-cadmium efflux system membrane fusion protein